MLVVRPTGVYHPHKTNALVWLAPLNRSRGSALSVKSLASKIGPERDANLSPALTTNERVRFDMDVSDLHAESAQAKPKGWLHRQLIDIILTEQPGAQAGGFWKAMRALPDAEYLTGLLAEDEKWMRSIRFTPDAFLVDQPNRTIVIYEAVHTNDISRYKMDCIIEFGWAVDSADWDLILCRVDMFQAVFYSPVAMWISEAGDIASGKLDASDRTRAWRKLGIGVTNAHLFPNGETA